MRRLRSLLVALALIPSLALAVLDEPYIVLRPDGTRVKLMAPPLVRGELLVGRLYPTGVLVSFPRNEIDMQATDRLNRPGYVPPTPTRTPYPTVGPHQTPPLGDMVRPRLSRAQAERGFRDLRKGRGEEQQEIVVAPKGPPPSPGSTGEEQYWRSRGANLKQRIRDAQAELEIAVEDREAWDRQSVFGSKAQRETWARELQNRRSREEHAKGELQRLREEEEALKEEARKAGAQPGWIR